MTSQSLTISTINHHKMDISQPKQMITWCFMLHRTFIFSSDTSMRSIRDWSASLKSVMEMSKSQSYLSCCISTLSKRNKIPNSKNVWITYWDRIHLCSPLSIDWLKVCSKVSQIWPRVWSQIIPWNSYQLSITKIYTWSS